MPNITVSPKFVNPPNKTKYASINAEGSYYSFDPDKIPLSAFSKGVPVTFEYSVSEKGYKNITRIIQSSAAGGSGASSSTRMSPEQEYVEGRQDAKDNKITRLALAKSCIEANAGTDIAEMWLTWVLDL